MKKVLGFGCMRLPLLDKKDKANVDLEQFKKMVDCFLAQGFCYFDTAYMYHNFTSEIFVRKALVERYPRERFLLATKLPLSFLRSKEDVERIFHEQLEKCGVDYFDWYLLHNLNRRSLEAAKRFGCFDFVKQKKAEGKIRHIAFSYHDKADLLDEILTAYPYFEAVQLQINYLDWESLNVQSRKCYETALSHGKKIIAMEPVKGGILAQVPSSVEKIFKDTAPDKSAASWAIRFAASHQGIFVVLSGMSSFSQLQDNVSYMKNFKPFDDKEFKIIEQAAQIINSKIAIPCTACGYCLDDCPKKIAIPEYFSLYNSYYRAHGEGRVKFFFNERNYYPNYTSNGKASECLSCHLCEKKCPQNIEISEWLKKVAELFEQ